MNVRIGAPVIDQHGRKTNSSFKKVFGKNKNAPPPKKKKTPKTNSFSLASRELESQLSYHSTLVN